MSAALSAAPPMRIQIGPLLVDTTNRTAMIGHEYLRLTWFEHEVLRLFAEAGGQPVSHDALRQVALRRNLRGGQGRTVAQLIHNLRCKMPPGPDGQPLIQMLYGVGYWMRPGTAV